MKPELTRFHNSGVSPVGQSHIVTIGDPTMEQLKKWRRELGLWSVPAVFKIMPSNAVVAEIGTDRGNSATHLNNNALPKELYLIDPWDLSEWANERWDAQTAKEETFKKFSGEDNVKIIQNYSVEASKMFDDNYFDWIYLDGSYEYADYKKDLAYWLPKVKKGGYIVGSYFNPIGEQMWPACGAIVEFILKYVAKKPQVIEQLCAERQEIVQSFIKQTEDMNNNTDKNRASLAPLVNSATWEVKATDHNKKYWFDTIGWEMKATHECTFIPSLSIQKTVLACVDYFPTERTRGDMFRLQIDDWVDDLSHEEIIEEANKTR